MISLAGEEKSWLLVTLLQTSFFQNWFDGRQYSIVHLDISLHDLDLHIRSHLYEEVVTSVLIFLQIFQSMWLTFSTLLWPVMVNLFTQGRELYFSDFVDTCG